MFLPHNLGVVTGDKGIQQLIAARYQELEVESILLQRDSSVPHQDHSPMQVLLMQRRLARAQLETQLYSLALSEGAGRVPGDLRVIGQY